MRTRRAAWLLATSAAAILAAEAAGAGEWKPREFDEESILEFRTVNAEGEGHWSKVWLVVLEDQVYVNLGDRAVERLKTNATAPLVSVRVGDDEFENVRVEPAQELQPAVAQAIADKYWTGFLVPYRPPSQVMRLRPDQDARAAAEAGADRARQPTTPPASAPATPTAPPASAPAPPTGGENP